MDQRFWNDIGRGYTRQVLSSLHADRRGVVMRRIEQFGDRRATAADFGCGVGHYLPVLAEHFQQVYGCDFAGKLLTQARRRCAKLSNVTIEQRDLVNEPASVSGVRFAVCANVLIMPDPRKRQKILLNIIGRLARGGRLLLVVPSLESALFVNRRYIEWNVKRGVSEAEARRAGLRPSGRLVDGVLPLDGVLTKHYLQVELAAMLGEAGLGDLVFDRAEYGWETEFPRPPRWLTEPYPWDWVVVGETVNRRGDRVDTGRTVAVERRHCGRCSSQ